MVTAIALGAALVSAPPPANDLAQWLLPLVTLTSNHELREVESESELTAQRDRDLAAAHDALASVQQALLKAGEARDAAAKQALRDKLTDLAGPGLDAAREATLAAIAAQRTLLTSEPGTAPPPSRRAILARAIASSRPEELAIARIDAHRHVARGLATFIAGDVQAAIAEATRACELAPDLPLAHMFQGSLFAQSGDKEGARLAWRRTLELDPNNEPVRAALVRLERPWFP